MSKDQDPEEGLGPEGKDRIHASGQALKKMGVTFDVILSSPKKRSKQTAAIVAEEVGFPLEKIVETPKVKAMTPPESVAEVASFLLTEGSKAAVQFEMGGCCRIDVDALPTHSGRLRWYLTPAQLKLIAS
ncbi:MAG: histidine phosphatase family protein [Deltaproteobacteria bacterium]|nr:histidine phosphatase family protein [Deltaproteobacteria bacterium]